MQLHPLDLLKPELELASTITKTTINLMVGRLVDEGRLDLSRKVSESSGLVSSHTPAFSLPAGTPERTCIRDGSGSTCVIAALTFCC